MTAKAEPPDKQLITFSFGENWQNFVDASDEQSVEQALADIAMWLGKDGVSGKRVLDIGSGSGIHSLCLHRLGASELVSVDVDPASVAATKRMWERAGRPAHWRVLEGSVLDQSFVNDLGGFDIVYSWGVLHHTGRMWEAIDNATRTVRDGGSFWIALYVKGPRYAADLALKQRYNAATSIGKKWIEWRWILSYMYQRARQRRNPLTWNEKKARGMNVYHDLVDWLGGLPYEVASVEETAAYCGARGFTMTRVDARGEGDCSIYLFRKGVAGAAST